MALFRKSLEMPTAETALPGRAMPIATADRHYVNKAPLHPPFPDGMEIAYLGMGCFWGAERLFWTMDGVYTTAVGYAGGLTQNPTYEEVCTGQTGHTELVMVVYDPRHVRYESLLKVFWEAHNPTQYMRQGNDVGTQYRSAIYTTTPHQKAQAEETRALYAAQLRSSGLGEIATEIRDAPTFYYAETYHQQYLAKNPGGYCGLAGTGVSCPLPSIRDAAE